MTATKTIKVKMVNTFHNSEANVVGEFVHFGAGGEYDDGDDTSSATVRISAAALKRAGRKLCGIAECCCGNHETTAQQETHDENGSWLVCGEVVK